jgi:hypothetical protein
VRLDQGKATSSRLRGGQPDDFAAHGVGCDRISLRRHPGETQNYPTRWRPAANNPTHRRIAAQTLGVVYVLVAGQPAEYRLPQQPDQEVLSVLAGACIRQFLATACGQSEHVVQLTIRQQTAIGGDHTGAKLKHQTAVKIEPQRLALRFTRWVRHGRPVRSTITY